MDTKELIKQRARDRKKEGREVAATYEDDYSECEGEGWAKKNVKEMNKEERCAYDRFRKKEYRKRMTNENKEMQRHKDRERKGKKKELNKHSEKQVPNEEDQNMKTMKKTNLILNLGRKESNI